MSVQIHRPTKEDAEHPPRADHAPHFDTASFHEVPPRSMRDLIGIAPTPSPATAARNLADAPQPVAAPVATAAPVRSNWRRHIGNARLSWSKLSGGELERVDGDQAKLVKLLLRHYSFDRHEAGRLVRNFFERNKI